MDANNLKVLRNYVTPDYEHLYGAPWLLFHRVDLHNGLKRLATIPRPSTAAVAKVNLASEIADIDLAGNITLADGTKMKKDLIVVADGIRVCETCCPCLLTARFCDSRLTCPADKIRVQGGSRR
jgi:hypothetical protein